jgi:N-acetylgalactosamine kinase
MNSDGKSDTVEVFSTVAALYGLHEQNDAGVLKMLTTRVQKVLREFARRFPKATTRPFIVRAPGRVNLIGEHVDQNNFDVMPACLETRDVIMAVSPTLARTVTIHNCDSQQYASLVYKLPNSAAIECSSNYMLCGYRGMVEACKLPVGAYRGMNAVMLGTVPPGAGLSSSSAVVVASAIATLAIHERHGLFSKRDIAALCARCERFVGVEGGGMDQAISLLGVAGFAQRISFAPLSAQSVKLPRGVCWVVSHSLVESHKAQTAAVNYNKRVVECRLASLLLAKALNLPNWRSLRRLRGVLRASKLTLDSLVNVTTKALQPGTYSLLHLSTALSLDKAVCNSAAAAANAIVSTFFTDVRAAPAVFQHALDSSNDAKMSGRAGSFALQARALHVLTETRRVKRFAAVAAAHANGMSSALQAARALGKLMAESHASLNRLFECSCPELNELVSVAHAAGSFGSRMTGAVWGRCTLSLVDEKRVDAFIRAVRIHYYARAKHISAEQLALKNVSDYIFATRPGQGAAMLHC